jgi:putative ABC transport system substrate-binding protein
MLKGFTWQNDSLITLCETSPCGARLLGQAATGSLSRVAALWNPDDPPAALSLKETETAASALGITVHPVEVRRPEDFDAAFATATEIHSDAIVLMPSPLMSAHPRELAASALRHRLPSTYWQRAYTVEGGLMSYGLRISTTWSVVPQFMWIKS